MCAACWDTWSREHSAPPGCTLAVLDACCGAGGAARGYAEAGFEVWGVDTNSRLKTDYLASGAHRFIEADVLDVLSDRNFVNQFDLVHVSPPCQHYSQMSRCRPGLAAGYPDLIGPVRELLEKIRRAWIIENVGAARPWLRDPVTLCGEVFERPVYRHRLFEPRGFRLAAPMQSPEQAETRRADLSRDGFTLSGRTGPNRECGWGHPVPAAKAGHWRPGMYVSVSGHERKEPVRAAMAIDWMRNRDDVKEALPPYMTRYIGTEFRRQLA